jgi:hypothetical protein
MSLDIQIGELDLVMASYYDASSLAIDTLVDSIREISAHMARSDNPHLVHKSHLGLGSVINLPIASPKAALDPTYRVGYTTPHTTHLIITRLLSNVNREFVGLGSVRNYPVASIGEAQSGTSNARYMTPFGAQQNVEANVAGLADRKGSVFFADEDYQPMMLMPGVLVNRNPALVEGAAEMDQLKGLVESFENVYDDWLRISHMGTTYPAAPEELEEWSYDPVADSIICTINSTTLIGFISPEQYTDYVFEVEISSTANDDDLIGVCFGYVEKDGRQYTLTASRSAGGVAGGPDTDATLFLIEFNRRQPEHMDLGSTNGGLMWGDGAIDDTRSKGFTSNTKNGWDKNPEGCRIRVERFGNVFTLKTTDLGSDEYKDSATVVVDLDDYPELEMFRGAVQFGYVCQSQANSTWLTHRRPVKLGTVVDIDTMETWSWDGKQFVQVTDPVRNELVPPNRLFFTEMTNKLYYHESFKGIMKISG